MVEIIRTFDILNNSKGKEIVVELKDKRVFQGKLKTFDGHLNLVLFDAKEENSDLQVGNIIIRGDTIVLIRNI